MLPHSAQTNFIAKALGLLQQSVETRKTKQQPQKRKSRITICIRNIDPFTFLCKPFYIGKAYKLIL